MKVPKNSGKILTTQEQTSKLEEKSQFSVISKTNRSSQSEQKTEPDKFHNMFHVSQFQTASHVWGCENHPSKGYPECTSGRRGNCYLGTAEPQVVPETPHQQTTPKAAWHGPWTPPSDLLATTWHRQGRQQECPSGEWPRRCEKCSSKEPSNSTVGEY